MPEYIIKQRGDTAAHWTAANPVLAEREIGWITDSSFLECKLGDGVTAWNDLPIRTGPSGPEGPPPPLGSKAKAGMVPAGGLPGEMFTALPDGSYGFVPAGRAAAAVGQINGSGSIAYGYGVTGVTKLPGNGAYQIDHAASAAPQSLPVAAAINNAAAETPMIANVAGVTPTRSVVFIANHAGTRVNAAFVFAVF